MKPKNFPARKLKRQIDAQRGDKTTPYTIEEKQRLNRATNTRTKKDRSKA